MTSELKQWRRSLTPWPRYSRATKKSYQTPEIDAISRRGNRHILVESFIGPSRVKDAFHGGRSRYRVEAIYRAMLPYLSANTES